MNDAHGSAAKAAATPSKLAAVVALSLAAAAASAQEPPGSSEASATRGPEEPAVLVIGTRRNLDAIPGSGDILERELLDSAHVFTTNEALRKVPGVLARDEEGFGLRPNIGIRGLNPTRSSKVLLLEDGIPLTYAPYGDNATYYHPPIERFERIEVLKGRARSCSGRRRSAASSITSRRRRRKAVGRGIASGRQPRLSRTCTQSSATRCGSTGLMLHGTHKEADGARDNMHFEVADFNFKLVHDSATARQSDAARQLLRRGVAGPLFRPDARRVPGRPARGTRSSTTTSTSYRWSARRSRMRCAFNDALTLTTNAYYTYFNRDWWRQSSNSSQRPNDASDPACGGMANLNTTCGNEGRLRQYCTGGVEPRVSGGSTDCSASNSYSSRACVFTARTSTASRRTATRPTSRTRRDGPERRHPRGQRPQCRSGVGLRPDRFDLGRFGITPGVRFEASSTNASATSPAKWRTSTRGHPRARRHVRAVAGTLMFAGVHRGSLRPASRIS